MERNLALREDTLKNVRVHCAQETEVEVNDARMSVRHVRRQLSLNSRCR